MVDNTGGLNRISAAISRSVSRRSVLKAGVRGTIGVGIAWVLAACGVGGTSPSAGPSGSAAPTAGGARKKVAFILPSYTQVRWKNADQKYFEEEAARQNLEVVIQVSNDDEVLQASQVENVLTQNIDVLVLTAVNVDTAKEMVAKANAANVPVIAYNYIIDDVELAAIISRDAKGVGLQIGEDALKTAPKGNYILLKGDQGTSVARLKAEGLMEALKPAIDRGDVKLVTDQWVRGWAPELAQSITENALTANQNNIQAVCALNDGQAYGAIEALKAQGVAGKAFVSGEDAEIAACKLIKEGTMTVSNFTPFNDLGTAAAKAAGEVANGKLVTAEKTINNGVGDVPWISVPTFNVSKENLDQFVADYPWWITPADLV